MNKSNLLIFASFTLSFHLLHLIFSSFVIGFCDAFDFSFTIDTHVEIHFRHLIDRLLRL